MNHVHQFCTYFDSRYLLRGLALYESLRAHCAASHLWVLCADDFTYQALAIMELPGVTLIPVERLESDDPQLAAGRPTRSRVEYYFTLTPCLPLYIFRHAPDVTVLTYLDADLFFFADPAPLFEEFATHSIAVIEHRFPASLSHLGHAGRFNVGWLSFRRDTEGLSCLEGWRKDCLEWCHDSPAEGRYADQKYLDAWPDRFSKLTVLAHKGANVAPWNLAGHSVEKRAGRLWVADEPLIFFHFHGLQQLRRHVYDAGLAFYGVSASHVVAREIYGRYIATIERLASRLPVPIPHSPLARLPRHTTDNERPIKMGRWSALKRSVRFWVDFALGRYLVVWKGAVLTAGR